MDGFEKSANVTDILGSTQKIVKNKLTFVLRLLPKPELYQTRNLIQQGNVSILQNLTKISSFYDIFEFLVPFCPVATFPWSSFASMGGIEYKQNNCSLSRMDLVL